MRGFIYAAVAVLWAGQAAAQAPEKVTLRLDWSLIGYHAPFFLARDRGYYKAAGLEVELLEGKGSGNTVQLVGNGTDNFGYGDAAVAARAVTVGVPVKVVMGIVQRGPGSIMFAPNKGLEKPQDLKGKSIVACATHGAFTFLPAFMKAVNLQMSDVKIVTVDCNAMYPLYVQGGIDAAVAFTPGSRARLATVGMTEVKQFDYADYGVLLPSHGIITNTRMIETKPQVVRAFVQASARGWEEAMKDVPGAIANLIEKNPIVKGQEKIFEQELSGYGPYLQTANTKGKPFGWQSAEDWKGAEQLLVQYMNMKAQPSVDAYFTNEFIAAQ